MGTRVESRLRKLEQDKGAGQITILVVNEDQSNRPEIERRAKEVQADGQIPIVLEWEDSQL